MFGFLGPEHLVVLALAALFIFGPERLPTVVRDAAGALRKLKQVAAGATEQLTAELGPEFADVDLTSLRPSTFVRNQLLGGHSAAGLLGDDPFGPAQPEQTVRPVTVRPLTAGESAPYDRDAT